MTRRERAIARLERRRQWAASREADAGRRFDAAHNLVKDIPLGQPVLIGHHSERRHRRVLDRADSNMRRGVESAKMAEHHASKAINIEAALERTIFSDDPDALETLAERIRYRTEYVERINALNKLIRKEQKTGFTAGWLDRIGATEDEKRAMLRNLNDWRKSPLFPPYVTSNMRNLIRTDTKRMEAIRKQQARQTRAEANGGALLETTPDGAYAQVSFSEKPAREILDSLRAAGFHWSGGSWFGPAAKLPLPVRALTGAANPDPTPAPSTPDPGPAEDSHGDLMEFVLPEERRDGE